MRWDWAAMIGDQPRESIPALRVCTNGVLRRNVTPGRIEHIRLNAGEGLKRAIRGDGTEAAEVISSKEDFRMDTAPDRGILAAIGRLATLGATGRLEITAGSTDGAVLFDRGQLVDARMGRLNGFQAINALAFIPDASFDFNPTIVPPPQSSITANERKLLKDFFGINASDRVDAVERIRAVDDEVTLVRPTVDPEPAVPPVAAAPPAFLSPPPARSTFRPALFLILLTLLVAAAAVALIYRYRNVDSTASVAPPAQTVDAPQQTASTSNVPNLSGNWKVVNTVEQTSFEAYRNMEIGFTVSINQAGKDFTGTGEKISENGRSLPSDGRTPIVVKGTINGDRVEATFSENGAARKTNGRFVWRIDKGSGGLTGTFVSSAARARGKSAAKKVL